MNSNSFFTHFELDLSVICHYGYFNLKNAVTRDFLKKNKQKIALCDKSIVKILLFK